MEQGTAQDGRHDEKGVCVAVSSMFKTSQFVAAIRSGPVVHEPLESVLEPH